MGFRWFSQSVLLCFFSSSTPRLVENIPLSVQVAPFKSNFAADPQLRRPVCGCSRFNRLLFSKLEN